MKLGMSLVFLAWLPFYSCLFKPTRIFQRFLPAVVSNALVKSEQKRFLLVENKKQICIVSNSNAGIRIKSSVDRLEFESIEYSYNEADTGTRFEEIFGFYDMPAGKHMLVVTSSEPLLSSAFPDIRKVISFKLLPVEKKTTKHLSESVLGKQKFAEMILLQTMNRHEFYFSVGKYDILKSYQANYVSTGISKDDTDDDSFFWNKDVIEPLYNSSIASKSIFFTKFCNAHIDSTDVKIGTENYHFTLVSRRSKNRQGPRYLKRGADENGNVANFVETEQVVHPMNDPNKVSCFLQVENPSSLFLFFLFFYFVISSCKIRSVVLFQWFGIRSIPGNGNRKFRNQRI
jgi:hypothetical protein